MKIKRDDKECVESLQRALEGVGHIEIDPKEGRVVVQTTQPWSEVQDKIESTGRQAVLSGFGGKSAVALINTTGCVVDKTPVQGAVRFTTIGNQKTGVVVDGVVDGLEPGLHGFHIHESGDVSQGCASVGDHYNPTKTRHGSPLADVSERHAGDLGNICADETGRATFRFVDSALDIWDIIGRAVVITSNADDFGNGGNANSLVDGNSGDR